MGHEVAETSAEVDKLRPEWELTRSLIGGTSVMRKAGETYLPKWPKEDDESYKARLATATLFPAFEHTVGSLAAKPFSRPFTLEGVPSQVEELLANVDMQGRSLQLFAGDIMEDVTGPGFAGILVDFPDAREAPSLEGGVRTQSMERAAGLRPYWVHIKALQILGWRAKLVDGTWKLTMLRIKECVDEEDGEFGVKKVDQVKVLEPGRWRIYREKENTPGDWILHDEGTTPLTYIPFAAAYGKREGFMFGTPPLGELAYLNVKHWQSQSDQDTILHVARVPILHMKGFKKGTELVVGAATAVVSEEDQINAEIKYVEHTGAAIAAGKTALDDLKEEMRQAGAELLVLKPGHITASQIQTESSIQLCELQRMAIMLEDTLAQALAFTADWLKLGAVDSKVGGKVTLFKDFGAATMAEARSQLLHDRNVAGKLSDETAHEELRRIGIISPDCTWEEEKERLDAQGPPLGMEAPSNVGMSKPTAPAINQPSGNVAA